MKISYVSNFVPKDANKCKICHFGRLIKNGFGTSWLNGYNIEVEHHPDSYHQVRNLRKPVYISIKSTMYLGRKNP